MSTQSKWLLAAGILTVAALLAFGLPTQTVLILGLLLLCSLMMFFMMGGKNTHGRSEKDQPGASADAPRAGPDKESK